MRGVKKKLPRFSEPVTVFRQTESLCTVRRRKELVPEYDDDPATKRIGDCGSRMDQILEARAGFDFPSIVAVILTSKDEYQ